MGIGKCSLESLGLIMFGNIYHGKKVFITGHTGFKGSWLALWLHMLGADVTGYSLEPPTKPNHFELIDIPIVSIIDDIRDSDSLSGAVQSASPDIVFHLAAQPLVRLSFQNPVETYETNIMGTVNLLQACRNCDSIRAIVNITSDKCYENREWVWGYREDEPMGGYDPYSSSKGCSELITASFRNSFFNLKDYGNSHWVLLASARAGNVIGGGDWAEDRLIPDIIRSIEKGEVVKIRSPRAIRPWQHVLEPLSGYLHLGWKLLEGEKKFAEGWNFGPGDVRSLTVEEVLALFRKTWERFEYTIREDRSNPHEATLLKLDCSRAFHRLGWYSIWDGPEAIKRTALWYRQYVEAGSVISQSDIDDYVSYAVKKGLAWAQD